MGRNLLFLVLFLSVSSVFAQMPVPTVECSVVGRHQSFQSRRYTGQLLSPGSVSLVARVSGEMLSVGFSDGDYVKVGQLLYQLDDIRYKASVQVAEANISRCEASLRYSKSNLERVQNLFNKNASTQDALDAALMAFQTDEANLASAKASLITAQDDLKNTKIIAPIEGKIGLTNYTVGSYLTPSSGVLATIVQLDPIRLSFSISNRDFLELFGTEKNFREDAVLKIRLADGSIYSQEGVFEFLNNEANRSTDTLSFFVKFANPDLVLVPGASVTVLLSKKTGVEQCSVVPSAIMADNDSPYVWVLDEANAAHRRNVVLGASDGNVQLIASGLEEGERIITEGTHKVMDGMTVKTVDRK